MNDVYAALAVAYLTVTLTTMSIAEPVRRFINRFTNLLHCNFCTSFWVSLGVTSWVGLHDLPLRVLAVAALANIAILLLDLSLTLFEVKDEATETD